MKRQRVAIAAGLVALVALAFSGVLDCGFVAFDDDAYVTDNPLVAGGLRARAIAAAFTSFHAGNWHPLTWISHMLDVSLFGMSPAGHHATSALLHALNAVLAFAALAELTGTRWRAAFAAALFAVHPLRVESVAWVAERKDVLSACFGLASLWAWARFAHTGQRSRYLWALGLFAAALLAKPMLVTLPFVLLLLDAWPLGRLDGSRALGPRVLEKLPFFALSAASCGVTLAAQSPGILTVPLLLRLENALVSVPEYLWRVFYPFELAAIYPYKPGFQPRIAVGAALLVGALSLYAFAQRRKRPWLGVGWLWFLGMLVPTLGFVQVGVQAFADRYTYLPFLGLALALSWTGAELAQHVPQGRVLAAGAAALVLAGCIATTREQVRTWHDSVSLFEHAIDVTRSNWFAHTELGVVLAAKGDYDHARGVFEQALRIRPEYPRALANLGRLEAETGHPELGIPLLERALANQPAIAGGRFAYASALEHAGRIGEAEVQYHRALEDPRSARDAALRLARLYAGSADAALRDGAQALALCQQACAAAPCKSAEDLDVCAMAAMEAGRGERAVEQAERALALARASGDLRLAAAIQARLDGYRRGRPVRVPPEATPSGVGPPR